MVRIAIRCLFHPGSREFAPTLQESRHDVRQWKWTRVKHSYTVEELPQPLRREGGRKVRRSDQPNRATPSNAPLCEEGWRARGHDRRALLHDVGHLLADLQKEHRFDIEMDDDSHESLEHEYSRDLRPGGGPTGRSARHGQNVGVAPLTPTTTRHLCDLARLAASPRRTAQPRRGQTLRRAPWFPERTRPSILGRGRQGRRPRFREFTRLRAVAYASFFRSVTSTSRELSARSTRCPIRRARRHYSSRPLLPRRLRAPRQVESSRQETPVIHDTSPSLATFADTSSGRSSASMSEPASDSTSPAYLGARGQRVVHRPLAA